jgi:hypothetical protein
MDVMCNKFAKVCILNPPTLTQSETFSLLLLFLILLIAQVDCICFYLGLFSAPLLVYVGLRGLRKNFLVLNAGLSVGVRVA